MENMFWIGFAGFALAAAFAMMQRSRVMSYSEGTEKMQKIAASIREGANAYLKHQYTTVAKVFAVVFVILLVMAFATGGEMLSKFTPFAFLTGRNASLSQVVLAGERWTVRRFNDTAHLADDLSRVGVPLT